jgi:hypothetical protein
VGTVAGNIQVTPNNLCGNGSNSILGVTVNIITANAGDDQTIPYGTSTFLNGSASNGSGSYSWQWTPSELLVDPSIQNPQTIALNNNQLFTLTVTDLVSNCIDSDNMQVYITGGPLGVLASANPEAICEGESSQLNASVYGGTGNYTYEWTSNPAGFTSNIQNPVVLPFETTIYIVNINDGIANVSDEITVTVSFLPEIPSQPIGPENVDIYHTPLTVYNTTTTLGADSYTWELQPTEMGILEPNGSEVSVSWQSIGTAFLSVKALNECGEVESESLQIMVDNSVGIIKNDLKGIVVYPNPTSDFLTIESKTNQIKQIIVINTLGIIVQEQEVFEVNGELKLSINNLPKGIYYLKLTTEVGVTLIKIIKI